MTDETSTPPILPPPKKSIWTRWWMIVVYVLIGLIALGGVLSSDDKEDETTAAPTTTIEGATTTTADEATTTTASGPTTTTLPQTTTTTVPPTTTTTAPPGFDLLTVEGTGDDFIEFSIPDDNPAVLHITYNGAGNFAVISYTADNDRLDLLVNEIGNYGGTVPVNFLTGEEVGLLEITASGPWSITAEYLFDLEVKDGEAQGSGDDVISMNISDPGVRFTHQGQSNFAVLAWNEDGRDLLINEIGNYTGTVRSPTGFVFYEITADGNWSVSDG